MTPRADEQPAGLFAREDWKILEAGDGEAGISLALEHQPELILCDLLMPENEWIPGLPQPPPQSTAHENYHHFRPRYGVDRISAIEAGADEYLVKPILWEHLHEVIERVLPNGDKAAILTGRCRSSRRRPPASNFGAYAARFPCQVRRRSATAGTPVASKFGPMARSSFWTRAPECDRSESLWKRNSKQVLSS